MIIRTAPMPKGYFPKGTIIKCNHCDKPLYKLSRRVDEGERVQAEQLKGIDSVQDPIHHERMICFYCEEDYDLTNIEVDDNLWEEQND